MKGNGKHRTLTYRFRNPVDKLKTIALKRELKVDETGAAFSEEFPTREAIPGNVPGLDPIEAHFLQVTHLKTTLATQPQFQGSFSVLVRTDFPDVPKFVDGHEWTFSVSEVQKQNPDRTVFEFVSTGTRFLYTLMIPVTEADPGRPEPNTSRILANFTPNAGPVPPQEFPEVNGPHFRIL